MQVIVVLLFGENPQAVAYSAQIKSPPPTTHSGAVRNDGAEIHGGGSLPECFTSSEGSLTSPFIINNPVETAAPFNVVSHLRCSEPRN